MLSSSSASDPALGDEPATDAGSALPTLVHRLWPWLAAALSGVLLTLCYPPFDHGFLVWTALTPLVCATWFRPRTVARSRWRAVWRLGPGYLTGLIFFASTFHWLRELAPLFATPALVGLPLLLGAFFGLYTAAWSGFLDFLVPAGAAARFGHAWRNLATGAGGASAWVMLEWVRGWLFGGFGWNGLGVALHRDLPMIQIAELTGVWGLSWLVAFVNLMAVIIVRSIVGDLGPAFLRRIRWEFTLTMALITAVFSYGVRALLKGAPGPATPLRIAAIQPNIPQIEKFSADAEDKVLDTIGRLTALAAVAQPPPQLIVWPESATPEPLAGDEKIGDWVLEIVRQRDFGLLLGTVDFDPARNELFNTATLLTGRGEVRQVYRKMHLVPFGEYLPLRPLLGPFLNDLLPGDFVAGRDFTVLKLNDPAIELAALVCFEDTLGDLTRRFVAGGAQLLVNVTNDGWFARSPAAEQHLANALFRAVETRRPLVRCGNTGLTGSIDPYGRSVSFARSPGTPAVRDVIPFLRPFEQGFVAGEIPVPTSARQTFYTRHGDWLPLVSTAIAALALIRVSVSLRFERRK